MTANVDDRLGPLALLVGTWKGSGRGEYPTVEPFEYTEELTFTDPGGKPFLFCVQRTSAADGRPLHVEAGYLRWAAGAPEWVLAQPTGIAEAHRGTVHVEDGRADFDFDTVVVASTPSAKRVDSVTRRLSVDGDVLAYSLDMAAVGEERHLHLEAELRRC